MIFADATLERGLGRVADDEKPSSAENSPLFAALSSPTTVSRFTQSVLDHAELAASYPTAEAVLLELLDLDAKGAVAISPRPSDPGLERFYRSGDTRGDRSLAYLATYERHWAVHREIFDFVEAEDANAQRKAFQRDLYLNHLTPELEKLGPDAAVLDAGCGVGRLLPTLLSHGFRVTCVDASVQALKCAVRVALRRAATMDRLDAEVCQVGHLAGFADNTFDATVALEVICYQDDPQRSLDELIRVTKPGGLLALSVEGLYGAAIADPKLTLDHQREVLDTGSLDVDDEISVRYFTKDRLVGLLEAAGLDAVEVVGTHYTADGVLDHVLTDAILAKEGPGRRELLDLEQKAAADPTLEPLARAWFAKAHVPQQSGSTDPAVISPR